MFWKKKNPEADVIIHESEDQRQSYRYNFKQGQGFQITFKEKKVWVLNISAGGIAFNNNGFKLFDFDFITFTLDIPNFKGNSTFYSGLRVLRIDNKKICHCIFEHCSLEQHELIHKYVLEMQKNDLAH
ncbi:PilZ domain-containing protein [Desulfobacula toluolica]|uniref:PilZ domain-containing protein n=1 Tax=Desulfobacula toluolica TaxID=28223 RepID=UPI0002FD409D|nr:PilZ domain-containing protein [Desulfobacula toluolica]